MSGFNNGYAYLLKQSSIAIKQYCFVCYILLIIYM